MISRKCKECKGEFMCYPSSKKKFCNMDCSRAAQSKRQIGKNNPFWKGGKKSKEEVKDYNREYREKNKEKIKRNTCIICSKKCRGLCCSRLCKSISEKKEVMLICEYCNKKHVSIPSKEDKRYCSKHCYDNAQSKKIKIVCEMCGKIKIVSPCYASQKYCSQKCKGLSKIGKNNPNWKNGATSLSHGIRELRENKIWRVSVFERDKYTCVFCGKVGGYIEAHHIISFNDIIKKNNITSIKSAKLCNNLWDVSNGITVCECCHGDIDEHRFIKKQQSSSLF